MSIGGEYKATPPSLADGDSSAVTLAKDGSLRVNLASSGGGTTAAAADATANPTVGGFLSFLMGFNGTTWDRVRTGLIAKFTGSSGATGILNTLGLGRYNASPPSLTDGDVQLAQLDVNGNARVKEMFQPGAEDNTNNVLYSLLTPVAVSTNANSSSDSAAAASAVVKASAGRLYQVVYYNDNAATRYLQFFNSTTVPADTTVPLISIGVATKASVQVSWNYGKFFSTGIAVCHSSTGATKTVGGSDGYFSVEYK